MRLEETLARLRAARESEPSSEVLERLAAGSWRVENSSADN
jgi:hypothetical protein